MNELAFADAQRPTPARCLRLNLRPYSLGHELILLKKRNPIRLLGHDSFSELTPEQQAYSVRMAALVCAATWHQNHSRRRFVRLWGWAIKNDDIALAIADFNNYLKAGLDCPKFAPPDQEMPGRSPGAPELLCLYEYVCKLPPRQWLPWGGSEWDYPLALARYRYYTGLEMDGKIRLRSESDGETLEEYAERVEQDIAAGRAAFPAPPQTHIMEESK